MQSTLKLMIMNNRDAAIAAMREMQNEVATAEREKGTRALMAVSTVPQQSKTVEGKLAWIVKCCEQLEGSGGFVVLPQEYFGGIQCVTLEAEGPVAWDQNLIVDKVLEAVVGFPDVVVGFGAVVQEGWLRRERYFVVSKGGIAGYKDKTWLPAYDHVKVSGSFGITPGAIGDREERIKVNVVGLGEITIGILFCWEVFSGEIWRALRRSECDVVVHAIKFGVKSWPQKVKLVEEGIGGACLVKGFGYGGDGGWLERLSMGASWDVCCPVICSTNSWEAVVRSGRAGALCGVLYPWVDATADLVVRGDTIKKDRIDVMYWRYGKQHMMKLFQETGKWPGSELREHTMLMKIRRMEGRT